MFQPGEVFDGKFRVERLLGQGGMGVVMVATHLTLDQKVAIKVLHDRVATDPSVVERLVREARAAARLRSEHVCRVSDVGAVDGTPYIVMELLDGSDLAKVISRGPLPIATAVDYVVQASVAIAEAHAQGIIHRDLKPANLFVTRRLDGTPLIKVLDFGIAKAQSTSGVALTQTETTMGTPGYMSPEQLRSARDVDARTDIWALGCILYQAVSGRLPFPATSITEAAVKITIDPPDPLDVDPAFRAVVFRCLEKEPAKRPRDVAELARELAPFGGPSTAANAALITRLLSASLDATMPSAPAAAGNVSATVATAVPTTTLEGAAGQPAAAPRRGRTAIAIGGVLALSGAAAVAWSVTRTPNGPPSAHVASPSPDAAAIAVVTPSPAPPPDAADIPIDAVTVTKTTKAKKARTIDDDVYDAQSAMIDGEWEDALRLAKAILARDAGNRTARHIGVAAACNLLDATTARELAAPLPEKNREELAKVPCASRHISLDAPAPAAAATPVAPNEQIAQGERDIDHAVSKFRCMEASRIATKLERDFKKDQPDAIKRLVAKSEACLDHRLAMSRNPSDPAAEPWIVAAIAELREAGLDKDAMNFEVGFYNSRLINACSKGDAAAAKAAAAKLPDGTTKDNSITFCKTKSVDLRQP